MTQTATVEAPDPPSGTDTSRPRFLRREFLLSERLWAWAGPLLITAVGGLIRFWHLGRPGKLVFDETYYVKEAASYLRVGYELRNDPSIAPNSDDLNAAVDTLWNAGNGDVFATTADFVVHPPVGKWMIAFGELLFGQLNPIGWRFSAAVVGTLSILMMGRIARRLFGSTLLGCTAALLLAVDGQHFVHSRTGLLDIFVMFWAFAGFCCIVLDRDRARERLAALRGDGPDPATPSAPWLGIRWWRLAGITCLGLCTATKWSGLYFTAVFMLMSVLWDLARRRRAGYRRWFLDGVVRDGLPALAATLVIIPVVYVSSWVGWFRSTDGYDRQWGAEHPASGIAAVVPDALRSLWHYHHEMWVFHVNLHATHPYMSNPWSWLVQARPTAFFYDKHFDGHRGCHVEECSQAITALGNPVIWWGATIAVGALLFFWALNRDWRAGAILAGLVGGYVPWFMYQERTIYTFYAVAFVPWVVLAATYGLGKILGPPDASRDRRINGALVSGGLVLAAVLCFWFFYPVLSAQVIPRADWSLRMWLPSWI